MKKDQLLRIGQAAKLLGITEQTLRNWEKQGHIESERTPTGHRRYSLGQLQRNIPDKNTNKTLLYVRVSTKKQEQAGNLLRQKERLMNIAIEKHLHIVGVFEDVASGLNENRKGLQRLLKEVKTQEISYVLIEYKDRLARFGFHYISQYLNELGCQIIIAEEKQVSEEQELVDDLIAITTSFSARIYGKRGGKKILEKIKTTLKEVNRDEDDTPSKVNSSRERRTASNR